MRSRSLAVLLGATFPCLTAACYSGGDLYTGLALANADDTGPQIVWDLEAESIPDIPFPNDVGTRTDLTSPTGRRVNVSRQAPTAHERTLRELVDRLDGFGTYAPIWLRFDGRLDVEDLYARQSDDDPSNDAVYLVNVDPDSDRFGEVLDLDFGSGPPDFGGSRFPLQLERSPVFPEYFPHDPRRDASNLMFETYEEDLDGDGILDPGEDTDGDGVLDHPNLWGTALDDDALLDPYRHLLSCYELESETLLIRAIDPLAQLSTYAVVITRELRGLESGSAVRSPFATINHLQQTDALSPLVDDAILAEIGIDLDQVAFAWSFTTQSISRDLEVIRAGLYGHGVLSRLATEFPPQLTGVGVLDNSEDSPNPYLLAVPTLTGALNEPMLLNLLAIPQESADALAQQYLDYVDYFIFAEIEAPAFIHPDDGAFRLDWPSGRAEYDRETIYINCAIPRSRGNHSPPFPVVMYNHGSGSTRLEILGFAAAFAELGMAGCAIDAYGHGLLDDDTIRFLADRILADFAVDLSALVDMVFSGRARDLNGDGYTDSGGDFWTANMVHTRDTVRQSAADYFSVIRVLRNFGATTMPVDVDGDGEDEIAGDFNGDGVADLGGEQDYYMTGQSLGGIVTAVTGAVEPAYTAIAPVVAGAGLTDVAARSLQPGMLEAIYLRVFGSLVVGERISGDRYKLYFSAVDVLDERKVLIGEVPARNCDPCVMMEPGDRVELENLTNRELSELVVPDAEGFRLTVATDTGDPLVLRFYRPGASEPYQVVDAFASDVGFAGEDIPTGEPLRALQDGYGMRRGTPQLRRLLGIAQMIVDPADPANYARFYHDPLDLEPEGGEPLNVLNVTSIGDMNVPVNTGAALGRIAGLIGRDVDGDYGVSEDQLLLDTWVVEGLEQMRRFDTDLCHHSPRRILFDIDAPAGDLPMTPWEPEQPRPRLAQVTLAPACTGSEPPLGCAACVAQPPLRAAVEKPWGISGQRFLYQGAAGAHAFRLPEEGRAFDHARFQIRQIGWYFASGGRELRDDACLAEPAGCDFMR